ncbi:MAG TPA: glycosyl transferase, partial [Pseudomonas sp.]|nr:glycosyl transferase [Pseudomonas sp.]
MDPYAAAVSDVYQDLFGEGSYTGKGIYDIDAFEAALAGRVPENTMLSHDLFEGVFARAGLATDVEVVEEFPSRYDVSGKRQHRWTRGDWQLLPWICGARSGTQALPDIGRFKMLDNLRRSLVAPLTLLALTLCWLLPLPAALVGTLLILATMAIPAVLPICFALLPARSGICMQSHLRRLRDDLRLAASQTGLNLVFLPDQAWRMVDAIVRTLSRLSSRRNLLEWTTAAQSAISPRLKLSGFYCGMAGGTALGVGAALFALLIAPGSWPVVLPFALLWLGAPAIALWASRSPRIAPRQTLAEPDAEELRLIARRTWRFFETFVTPADNMLPPDNFQEDPKPVVARRTSPTNMGLYLLSAITARDFGWAGTLQTLDRLEATLESMSRLQRHRGHFFNWYATEDMRALEPPYVSAVDSGNLAGHLIALANACEEWLDAPTAPNARAGLQDTLVLIRQAMTALPSASGERGRPLSELLDEISAQLDEEQALDTLSATLQQRAEKAARLGLELCPPGEDDESSDLRFWIDALGQTLAEHARDRQLQGETLSDTQNRLRELSRSTRQMALEMDFAFLLDPERKLLSIGYGLAENSLDPSCYDLLASEARLASLFAIA